MPVHFFANYQNIEFEESEKPDFNNDDFFRGPPKLDEKLVLEKAKSCDTLEFGAWVISHIPKEYFDFNGHINTFTHKKIEQMLKFKAKKSIEAASAWIFTHCLVLEPKLYVESREGSIPLD